MTAFPPNATDGQLHAADNGAYYVYNQSQNQWQSTTVIPKWTDQVFVRGQDNVTQQNTNDSAEQAIKRGANQSVQRANTGTRHRHWHWSAVCIEVLT